MNAAEYGRQLAADAPPITAAQGEAMARILATVETEGEAA